LLTVCLVAALPALPAARALRVGVCAAITLSFVVFAGWNVHTARAVENQQYLAGQSSLKLAQTLRGLSHDGHCYFASQFGFPEIAFASGCRGATFDPSSTTIVLPTDPGSTPVYVLTVTDPAKTAIQPLPGTVRRLRGGGISHWWLFAAQRHGID
jgi:hypothetical protein